jgi:hypothetical protein
MGRYLYLGWIAVILLLYMRLYQDLFPAILSAFGLR